MIINNIKLNSDFKLTVNNQKDRSDDFISRLCDFYKNQPKPYTSDVWTTLYKRYSKLHDCLIEENIECVRDILGHLYLNEDVMYGLDLWNGPYEPGIVYWFDSFKRLGSSTGVVPLDNPEQPDGFISNIEEVLNELDKWFGCKISNCDGLSAHGFLTNERFITRKYIDALCAFATIIRGEYKHDVVLEIGAGLGNMCCAFFNAFGSNVKYHAINLPIHSVMMAYFVSSLTGEKNINMDGEVVLDCQSVFIHGTKVEESLSFDAVINQDSFPELNESVRNYYAELMVRQLKGNFFSFNQESSNCNQVSVNKFFGKRKEFKCISRHHHWGRSGYVEEIFKLI